MTSTLSLIRWQKYSLGEHLQGDLQARSMTPPRRTKLIETLEDQVARSFHEAFDALPAKCKPRTSENGVREWVPLSGIAVVGGAFRSRRTTLYSTANLLVEDERVKCVALGLISSDESIAEQQLN